MEVIDDCSPMVLGFKQVAVLVGLPHELVQLE